jgi:Zn-dependent protease with chaperone function
MSPVFAVRAILALSLLLGLYVLAFAISGALLYMPYAELVYGHRVSPKLALFGLAGACAILRALVFVPRPTFLAPGPELRESEQPELFALIRDLAARMRTRMPSQVYLVPDVNAFVAEVGGFLGFGARRVMGIGLGLLHVDDVSNLRATIAHELGHYAGGHTRLGGVVYGTRAAIGNVLDSLGEGWLSKPFEWYGHLYMRLTRSLARRQELEADRAGVELAGKDAHIDGLRIETRAGAILGAFVRAELVPLLVAQHCPSAIYDGFQRFVAQVPTAEVDEAIAEVVPHRYDTHPTLADRIAYAERLPDPGVERDRRPALTLLRNAKEMEAAVEPYLFGELGIKGALARMAWDDISKVFYAPRLQEEARALGERLYPILRAGPRYADVALALARFVRDGRRVEPAPADGGFDVQHALGVLGGAALVECGGEWTTSIGAPLGVRLGGETLLPFTLAHDATETREGLEKYVRTIEKAAVPAEAVANTPA